MADIFISYAEEDRDYAQRLAHSLERRWSVWWDRDIRGGERFRQVIERELGKAKCVLVLWSPASVASRFVLSEAERGAERHVLIPLLIDNVDMPLGFGEFQAINLARWKGDLEDPSYRRLVSDLGTHLDAPVVPPDAVPPASTPTAVKRALLVAMDSYECADQFAPLGVARESMQTVERVLGGNGCGFGVTTFVDPSRQELQIALLDLFRETGPQDLLVFYFCGHARINADGDLYLCTKEARDEVLDATAIPLNWLAIRTINKTAAAHVVLMLDCRYGIAGSEELKGDIPAVLQSNLAQGKGKYVVTTATVSDQDIAKPRETISMMAKWLVRGLERFEADDGDNVITADEICRYLKERIEHECPQMMPASWGFNVNSGQGEFVRRTIPGTAVPSVLPDSPFFKVVRALIEEQKVVPFVGDGIFSSGPLSSFSLVSALAQKAGLEAGWKIDERYPLATAAEYVLQVYRGERGPFLKEFSAIVEEQTAESRTPAVYDWILGLATPWIVVSATYDRVLEQRLEEANLPYAVVTHIQYSEDSADDGKLLVIRRGAQPEVMLADRWTFSDLQDAADRVIYKIVGSPAINRDIARQDWGKRRGIDTVVATETDHMTFLARLQNEHMRIPDAFSRRFQTRSLLFLGYNLDAWHYRLVGHLFSDTGPIRTKHRYAVRAQATPIEERFWDKLVSSDDRLKSDCEAFVQTLRQNPDY